MGYYSLSFSGKGKIRGRLLKMVGLCPLLSPILFKLTTCKDLFLHFIRKKNHPAKLKQRIYMSRERLEDPEAHY